MRDSALALLLSAVAYSSELQPPDLFHRPGRQRVFLPDASERGPSEFPRRISPPKAGEPSISLHKLLHKPPRKARSEYLAAEQAHRKGEFEGAIKLLESAVAIDPGYGEAHTMLGMRLLEARQPARAVEVLSRAVSLDSSCPLANLQLAMAHLALRQPEKAERPARRAVQLASGSNSTRAHYALGLSLAQQGKPDAARFHLKRAAEEIPRARFALRRLPGGTPASR
jgi:tetratricopeptide (TPR) repeat protein